MFGCFPVTNLLSLSLGSIRTHTFVPADLDVGEQADLDDLPQQTEDQVLPALLQVLSPDVHHVAADGRRRVQSQVQILLLDPKAATSRFSGHAGRPAGTLQFAVVDVSPGR